MPNTDTAIVNLPLGHPARGGSLDAAISKAVREIRNGANMAHKARLKTARSQKDEVRSLLARMTDERVMQLAAPLGVRKPATARAALLREASFNFDRWIASLSRELAA